MTAHLSTLPSDALQWLNAPALTSVLAALEAGGSEGRIVGGAVRNAILGLKISDIDLATPAPPEMVIKTMTAAGLRVYPTGIEHGTVTVVADGQSFEMTTLRRDIETDGRRAVVAFTDDWRADSLRRDFTINAIYADRHGRLFDYHGGIDDLANGRVRFIGNAESRIREDYLRILRFFRFTAEYGRGDLDATSLAACVALKAGLGQLSAERIGAEVLKLLASRRAAELCRIMEDTGIARLLFGTATYPGRLAKLRAIETAQNLMIDPVLSLGVLTVDSPADASQLARRLKLSHAHADALRSTAARWTKGVGDTSLLEGKTAIYHFGADAFRRMLLASWARSATATDDPSILRVFALERQWIPPRLPISGDDVLALGVPAGPRIGAILNAFETWWIEENFPTDSMLHRKQLGALIEHS